MKLVKVVNLKGGEVLDQDVLSNSGEVLIVEGTVLKQDYIDILIQLDILTIYIILEIDDVLVVKPILEEKQKQYFYYKIKEIIENHIYNEGKDLSEVNKIGNEIVEQIVNRKEKLILIEERNECIYEHICNVTFLSVYLAHLLNVDSEKILEIAYGCILHDLGLRYVTISYFNKELDEFTANELYEYKKHTIYGYTAISGIDWISSTSKNIVLSHHENLDGTGYPLKQKVKQLALNIVQISDCFERYLSGIGCRKRSKEEALQEILNQKDMNFDKRVVNLLKEIVV